MEGNHLNKQDVPPLQRGSSKRAVLVPQVTNLKFEFNDLESFNTGGAATSEQNYRNLLKPRKSVQRLKSLHLKTDRSLDALPSVLHVSNNNIPIQRMSHPQLVIDDEIQTEEDKMIEQFMDHAPNVHLTKEDSKLIRTRVIEEMYRIQERAKITPEERQKLFQIAVSMDAPKLARKLVSEAKDMRNDQQDEPSSGGAFLTGEYGNDHHHKRHNGNNNNNQQSNHQQNNSSLSQQLHDSLDEDEMFCKAFDEVERIRKRILQRASNAPSSSLSPVRQKPQTDVFGDLEDSKEDNNNNNRNSHDHKPQDEMRRSYEKDQLQQQLQHDSGFENIKLMKKSSFRRETSSSSATSSHSKQPPPPSQQHPSPNLRSASKIYPENLVSSSSNSGSHLGSRPSSHPAPPSNHLSHSNSSHSNHNNSNYNNRAEQDKPLPPSISLDDNDLQITKVIDSLIGNQSRQTSLRGLQIDKTPPKDPNHKKKNRNSTGSNSKEKNSNQSLNSDDTDDHNPFSFYDPFLKADRKHFKMDSSLLRSAENELKMVQEKLAKFENVGEEDVDEYHDHKNRPKKTVISTGKLFNR
jgi:hypothetical protein